MAGILRTDTIQNSNTSTIITQTNSTTITIGTTGQTVALASGASSSGFGATYNGAVNWSSTIYSANFTAVSGNGYYVDTSAGSVTVTLPASPATGDIVAIKDWSSTAATNIIIVGRNGQKIEGNNSNGQINVHGDAQTLVFSGASRGWMVVGSGLLEGIQGPEFVSATGGTVLTCGNYKVHVFTSSGCFVVSNGGNDLGSNSVEYLVVAGGGGAGDYGGGGGAGGFRQNYPSPAIAGLPVTSTTYPITVGAGGAPVGAGSPITNGANSVFSTITSAGGGGGSGYVGVSAVGNGGPGGSGGGGGASAEYGNGAAGTGNTPPVSPSQGNPGGSSVYTPSPFWRTGGGGGGAGGAGTNGAPYAGDAGPGGVGSYWANPLFGPTAPSYGTPGPVSNVRYFSGGGGGSFQDSPGTSHQGSGGAGGGGPGLSIPSNAGGANGTTNTGGGGGGNGRSGGSGIVVIRYKYQ